MSQKTIEVGQAELVTVGGAIGAGNSKKGSVKFRIEQHHAAELLEELGQHAYSCTFNGKLLGGGMTIAGVSGKPDDQGDGQSSVTLNAPESALPELSRALGTLLGKVSSLVLTEDQLNLDLTTRQE